MESSIENKSVVRMKEDVLRMAVDYCTIAQSGEGLADRERAVMEVAAGWSNWVLAGGVDADIRLNALDLAFRMFSSNNSNAASFAVLAAAERMAGFVLNDKPGHVEK